MATELPAGVNSLASLKDYAKNLARDKIENDILAADLEDLRETPHQSLMAIECISYIYHCGASYVPLVKVLAFAA